MLSYKATNVVILDLRESNSYTDFLVIASADSNRHVTSISENTIKLLKEKDIRSYAREGLQHGNWALMDFGDVVVHVFYSFTREVYDLEGLWKDVPRIICKEK